MKLFTGTLLSISLLLTSAISQAQSSETPAPSQLPLVPADATAAKATDRPSSVEAPRSRWEAGVALGGFSYPDWRGADHRNTTFLPLPFVIYRGERVRLAREGLRVRLLDSDRVSLNLAAAFSLAGDANDNAARDGMEELLSTFRAGPVLTVNLDRAPDPTVRFDFRLPVYAVAATDFKRFESAGFTAFPSLRARYETQRGGWGFRTGAALGVELATAANNEYFYEVRPDEARPGRPAYDAEGGYGGLGLSGYAGAIRGRWGYGVFVRFDDLHGATFADSPLVQTKNFVTGGFGISYTFYRSRTVGRADEAE